MRWTLKPISNTLEKSKLSMFSCLMDWMWLPFIKAHIDKLLAGRLYMQERAQTFPPPCHVGSFGIRGKRKRCRLRECNLLM